MKRLLPLILILLAFLPGCQSPLSPIQQATIASDSLGVTEDALVVANRAKAISDSDFAATAPYIQAARAAVAKMFAAAEAGSQDQILSAFRAAADEFAAAQAKLLTAKAAAQRVKISPVTKPVLIPAAPAPVDDTPTPPGM